MSIYRSVNQILGKDEMRLVRCWFVDGAVNGFLGHSPVVCMRAGKPSDREGRGPSANRSWCGAGLAIDRFSHATLAKLLTSLSNRDLSLGQ